MRISLITPCLNQERFLEQTIRSILDQQYADLEYIVVDGKSTDGSTGIIQKYADRMAHWESEPDTGMYDALQKGFNRATGEIMGWLNADDLHAPWALSVVAEIFEALPEVEWLTSLMPLRWDARGRAVRCLPHGGYAKRAFFAGEYLPRPGAHTDGWIQQESTFWRRSLWERAGSRVATDLRLAGDFELWARFFEHAVLYGVETPLGGFRFHGAQLTGSSQEKYVAEAMAVLDGRGFRESNMLSNFARRNCPPPLAQRLGLLRPVKVCRHHKVRGVWTVVESLN